jgi:hypothetical protein
MVSVATSAGGVGFLPNSIVDGCDVADREKSIGVKREVIESEKCSNERNLFASQSQQSPSARYVAE